MNHSYSNLTLWEQCPWLFYKKNIVHEREEQNPDNSNLNIGNAVHKSVEFQLKGATKEVSDFNAFKEVPVLNDSQKIMVKSMSIIPEIFKKEMEGLSVREEERRFFKISGLYNPFVIKMDAYAIKDKKVILFDWKTGAHKENPEETHQLGLYAWGMFNIDSHIEEVECNLFYLKLNECTTATYTRKSPRMLADGSWAVKTAMEIERAIGSTQENIEKLYSKNMESMGCSWCPYRVDCFSAL